MIPQNYVETLLDEPEPNEPPPPLTTFSNTYHNRDSLGSNNLYPRTSLPTSHPPPYEPPQYMNPTPTNNWSQPDVPAWSSSSAQSSVRYNITEYLTLV